MLSPSGTTLAPNGVVTQVLKVANPGQVKRHFQFFVSKLLTNVVFTERFENEDTNFIHNGRKSSAGTSGGKQFSQPAVGMTDP